MGQLRYITAGTALNITNNGKTADWHRFAAMSSEFVVHGINYHGAESVFGTDGLFDAKEFLESYDRADGITLCADNVRAFLDMVFNSVFNERKPVRVHTDDYMLDLEEIYRIKAGVEKLMKVADEEQKHFLRAWMNEEES